MRAKSAIIALVLAVGTAQLAYSQTGDKASIINSKHDFRAASTAQIRSITGQDACIFCHTPHNSSPGTYLWNHKLSSRDFPAYNSTTMKSVVAPIQPQDVSKLCLSCHDGTIALGDTVNDGSIPFVQGADYALPASLSSNIAGDQTFANDHPFGFVPSMSTEIVTPPAQDAVKLDKSGKIQCTSCHDPHKEDIDTVTRKFLVKPNQASALCVTCHQVPGWDNSVHNHPLDLTEDSKYTLLQGAHTGYNGVHNNGCESCHRPHAPDVSQRLVKRMEENVCFACHNGSVTNRNIQAEFTGKTYKHPVLTTPSVHDASEGPNSAAYPLPETSSGQARHAECFDCHNGHMANTATAQPPLVSGALAGVTGQSTLNTPVPQAVNEYEVCFKCHADSANKPQLLDTGTAGIGYGRDPQRQFDAGNLNAYNTRIEFTQSISYHPVTQAMNLSLADVPSLRSNVIAPGGAPIIGRPLSGGSQIYCTDCHNNDTGRNLGTSGTGPTGPHGSNIPHILERSNTLEPPAPTPGSSSPGVSYTLSNYALCDKCHDVQNSVMQDRSFRLHSMHVQGERAACSTCHDPHASSAPMLINFDRSIVAPNSAGVLQFTRTGTGHGTCSLRCHGENHNNESY
ncbi:MAG: cytochrome c3 family protein [Actinomycetota bacterium]